MDELAGIIRTCEFKQDRWQKRKDHAHLMLELVQRFNSQFQKSSLSQKMDFRHIHKCKLYVITIMNAISITKNVQRDDY